MKYDLDRLLDRRGTDTYKWERIEPLFGDPDIIPVWIADIEFAVMPEITQALSDRAAHPSYGYTDPPRDLFDNIISWNRRRNGIDIDKKLMFLSPDVTTSVTMGLRALVAPGDRVIVNTPAYHPFFDCVSLAGAECVELPLVYAKDRYDFDFESFEEALRGGAKAFVFCNPQNPVGRIWTKDEIARIASLCARYHVAVIADEVHSDLILSGEFTSFYNYGLREGVRFILANAPSKGFGVPGLRTSFGVASDADVFKGVSRELSACSRPNLFGYTAANVAYTKGDDWIDQLNGYLARNAAYVVDFLQTRLASKVSAVLPQATFLMWLDFSGTGLAHEEIAKRLIEQAKVWMNDGREFHGDGERHFRLNIACPREMLETVMERIASAFEER